jgi:RHS repeat-associated protein
VLQTSNALGHTTSYAYDPLGRVVSQTDALGGVTSFRYDALGNRLSLTDPVDNTTTWTYDALNRVVQETNELGHSRCFVYNHDGYLTRRIDRRGLVREFQYDTLGRNAAEIWYDTAADAEMDANRQNTLNFTYDALGRMLSAGDQFASYAYTYDRLGRMTSSDAAIAGLAPTVTLTNAYDAAGRRTQVAAAIGGNADFVTDYAYDQLGRTTSIRQYASTTSVLPVADRRVDLTYDAASQAATLTRFADLSGNQLVAATDYLFDQAGRLTSMTHGRQLPLPPGEGGGEGVFADYDWTFDEANRMTRFESLIDGVADYTNDDTGQLTAAEYTAGAGLPTAPPDEQYVYDENGNRVNNGYTVGPNNQLISDGTHTYTYDAEGNRTSKTHIATGEVTEYHWDHRNRLTRVSTRATANGPLTTDIHYAYDFGQRWVRKVFNAGQSDERSTIFVHDGGDEQNPLILHPIRPPQIVLHFDREGAGDASEPDLAHRYLWGPNVDQILADEQLGSSQPPAVSNLLWPLTDHLNTVRDLATYDASTDTTTIVNHLTYDAFGNIAAQTDPSLGTLFHFTARPFDRDTGLQNNLNRWYDPSTGRWISEDPIGFEAGDGNLLRYVRCGPVSAVDPFGLRDFDMYIHYHFTNPLMDTLDMNGVIAPAMEAEIQKALDAHVGLGHKITVTFIRLIAIGNSAKNAGWIKTAEIRTGVRLLLTDDLKGGFVGYSAAGSLKAKLNPDKISSSATGQFARGVVVAILHEFIVHGVGGKSGHWHSAGFIDADKGGQLKGAISKEAICNLARVIGGFGVK